MKTDIPHPSPHALGFWDGNPTQPTGLRPGPPGPGGQRAGQNPVGTDRGSPGRPQTRGKGLHRDGPQGRPLERPGLRRLPLHLFGRFFQGKPTELLLGPGVTPDLLNDDRMGRMLDTLVTGVFLEVAREATPPASTSTGGTRAWGKRWGPSASPTATAGRTAGPWRGSPGSCG